MTIGSFFSPMSNHYKHLQLVAGEDTFTKEISVIDESVHVAVRLQLLEMSSITKLNQTVLNV